MTQLSIVSTGKILQQINDQATESAKAVICNDPSSYTAGPRVTHYAIDWNVFFDKQSL